MMQPNEPMDEQLLGYLLESLEPGERRRLEAELARDTALQRALEAMNDSLEPLRLAPDPPDPPAGLAQRTCQMVAAYQAGAHVAAVHSFVPASPQGF